MISVLAVDDSAVARCRYRDIFTVDRGFNLLKSAPNAVVARKCLSTHDPDVVVLDLEMPAVDGLSFLKWLMRSSPLPVVISSSLSTRGADQTVEAFSLGAVDVVCKQEGLRGEWGADFATRLMESVRAAAKAKEKFKERAASPVKMPWENSPAFLPLPLVRGTMTAGRAVAIGASTGGPEALSFLLRQFPPNFPPVLIVQHMPRLFTRSFADRLGHFCAIKIREAKGGERLESGHAYVAPGGSQMRLVPVAGGGAQIQVLPPEEGQRHAPSVDVLFESVAQVFCEKAIGILLTGMGRDGAKGLLRIQQMGGTTIAQDEKSCICYGMPKEAARMGAAQMVLPLDQIARQVTQLLSTGAACCAG